MVICIFGNTIVKAGKEDEEAQLVDKLKPVLRSMPGFISWKNYTAEDGEVIGLIRFDSRESLDAWAHEGHHLQIQKMAPEISMLAHHSVLFIYRFTQYPEEAVAETHSLDPE